jgi:hypothetical protein
MKTEDNQGILCSACKETESTEQTGTLSTVNNQAVCYSSGFCPQMGSKAYGIGYAEEQSPTLRTTNDSAVCYGICSDKSNSMLSGNPHSGIYEADTSRILDNNGGNPACNQGGMIVLEGNGSRESHKGDGYKQSDIMYTLNTIEQHAVCCLNDQGGSVMSTTENITGTLRAQEHGHQPIVYDARGNGNGDLAPTITGDHQDRVTDYTALCIGNGQMCNMSMKPIANSLDTMHDQQAVMTWGLDRAAYNQGKNAKYNFSIEQEKIGAQMAKGPGAIATQSIVRRLTPIECERLQGFPSGFEVDVSKMTKDEYIAFNLASGNIIADAETGKVYATRGPGGLKLDEPVELKGTEVNGYRVVSIRNGHTKLQCRVHRIIWISKNGIIPDGYCIDHINNDKKDNRISNLQLLTPEENSHKAKVDGLYKCGLDNKASKIDPAIKDEIAFVYAISDLTQRQLAQMYGISKSRINQIIKEVGWTDIGEWTDSKGKKHKDADSPRDTKPSETA